MSDVAEKTAEVVADQVEDAIDGVVDVVEVVRNNPAALAVVGFAGVSVGVVTGYLVARKRLKSFYEDLSTREIAEAKAFYAGVYKTDEDGAVLTPQDVMAQRHGPEAAAAALRDYQGRTGYDADEEALIEKAQTRAIEQAELRSVSVDVEPGPHGGTIEVVEEKVERRNVFLDPNFDMEEEVRHRTPDKPYIIHHDEFFAAERDFETIALTYFAADDTLVGEDDLPVQDVDGDVGLDHLVRFGHGSKDPNKVYVRNEKKGVDYEITQSTGSYVDEVLDLGPEAGGSLKHSNRDVVLNRRRDFRRGDG